MKSMKFIIICFVLAIGGLCKTNVVQAQTADVHDSLILVELYNSTNGSNWFTHETDGWLTKAPLSTWLNVSIDYNGKVTALYLSDNNLDGTIPSSLGNLSQLLVLAFSSNKLTGNIPTSLGSLSRLQELYLDHNQLSGSIPPSLGNLTNNGIVHIFDIDLSYNQLTGTIPIEFGRLTRLSSLSLNNNQLSGAIPSSFKSFVDIKELNFAANQLSGIVPLFSFVDPNGYIALEENRFTFDGIEQLVQAHQGNDFTIYYEPQAKIPIFKNGLRYSVNAGGTLSNNTYEWYDETGTLVATIPGNATFTAKPGHNYSAKVANSIATSLTLETEKVDFIDPNPSMINTDGTLSNDISRIDNDKIVTGAATDGITKVLITTNTDSPVTFSLANSKDGFLSSLTDQNLNSSTVTMQPVNGKVVVVYTVPDGYGESNPKGGRDIIINAEFKDGTGNEQLSFHLVTPPVVLVHGMWSNPETSWIEPGFVFFLQKSKFSNIQFANYKDFNFQTFDPKNDESKPARNAIRKAIYLGLDTYHSSKIAVTQVDVVGHSLGAQQTKSFSQETSFVNPVNYNKGYIHKLISIGSPHLGSILGPILYEHRGDLEKFNPFGPEEFFIEKTLAGILELKDMRIGSCQRDFDPWFKGTGKGYDNIEATRLFKVHAIGSTWQINGELQYSALSALTLIFKGQTLQEALGDKSNDVIVPRFSQLGGLAYPSHYDFYDNTTHSPIGGSLGQTANPDIQAKVASLLISDDKNMFAGGFPAPRMVRTPFDDIPPGSGHEIQAHYNKYSYPLNRSLKNPISSYNLKIVKPLRGEVFSNNGKDSLNIELYFTDPSKLANTVVILNKEIWATTPKTPPFTVKVGIPKTIPSGKLLIAALGNDVDGNLYADTASVVIGSTDKLVAFQTQPITLVLDSNYRQSSLAVTGLFVNGTDSIYRDLSSISTGTTYTAKRKDTIITINSSGLMTARKAGTDTIFIKNGIFKDTVLVTVNTNLFLASKAPNTITFTVTDKVKGDPPFALTATSTSEDPVKYQLISGPVTLSNGIVTINDTGTVSIKASVGSNAYFKSASSVTRTFKVILPDQVITTKPVTGSPYCAGNTISVPYTASGTFNTRNNFVVQLSDTSGRFIYTENIGAIASTSSGTITATIPTNEIGGNKYRIRVVSDNPAVAGTDNGSNLTITARTFFYKDADGDKYGSKLDSVWACAAPAGYVSNRGDCNDNDPNIHPGALEKCDGIDNNCDGRIDEKKPSATITPLSSLNIYQTHSVILQANSGTGYTYQWQKNTIAIPGVTSIKDTATTKGLYQVIVTNNALGCTTISKGVAVDSFITGCNHPTITPSGTAVVCSGSSITLSASALSGGTYQWLKNGVPISGAVNQSYTTASSGNYQVVESINICKDTSLPTTLSASSLPSATITALSSLNIYQTRSVVLQANSGTGYTYQWQQDNSAIAGATGQQYTATQPGTYTVAVTNSSGCSKTSAGKRVIDSAVCNTVVKIWDKGFNGSAGDNFYTSNLTAVLPTSDDGYIVGGSSNAGASGDKSQPNHDPYNASDDYWIIKTDAKGVKQWDKSFGTSYDEQLTCLQQTKDGGYIFGGSSALIGSPHGDRTDTARNDMDYWIIKTDANGVKQWDKAFGGASIPHPHDGTVFLTRTNELGSIQQTKDGGYILGGSSNSNRGNDKSQDSKGGYDFWVVKTDSNGMKQWDVTLGGSGSDDLISVIQASDGGYILAGNSNSPISGDKTQPSRGKSDIWIVKIDSNGVKQWDAVFGGFDDDGVAEVKQTKDGGYILGGGSLSNSGGDKTQDRKGTNDLWIVKITDKGVKQWDVTLGGSFTLFQVSTSSSHPFPLDITADGGYIVGESSSANISGDKTQDSYNNSLDYWIVKLNSKGVKQWDARFGGDNDDVFNSVRVTKDGGYILGGSTYSGISGDKSEPNKGGYDYWIVKLNCPTAVVSSLFYKDADGDGYGDPSKYIFARVAPSGYVTNNKDCNDANKNIHPGATEICGNGIDDNCNGQVDEGCTTGTTWYRDADGDGWGNPHDSTFATTKPRGYVSNKLDCDDKDSKRGGPEVCDGIDNDCDGIIDNGLPQKTFYSDFDHDGYGSDKRTIQACAAPPRYVAVAGDCNDDDSTVHPGAKELCDGKDNDCNGTIDDGLPLKPFYWDHDKDGYGFFRPVYACAAPRGYISVGGDCNDNDPSIHPGAIEHCDGIDEDCDGVIDNGFPQKRFYKDEDGDGWGGKSNLLAGCAPPGYVEKTGDCDDHNPHVHPGAPEICGNGIDDNCNGLVDEGCNVSVAKVEKALPKEPVTATFRLSAVPNPSHHYFNLRVESSSAKPVQVRVVDAVGRVVEAKQHIASNTTIAIGHNYRPGVYYVQAVQAGKQTSVKLVKTAY